MLDRWLVAALLIGGQANDARAVLFWAGVACFGVAAIWGTIRGLAPVWVAVARWILSAATAVYGVLDVFNPYFYLAIAAGLQVGSIAVGIYAYLEQRRETAASGH